MTKKERARRLTYEALVILGVLALLLYLCRLWPLLLLTLLGIFLAAARLLVLSAATVRPVETQPPPSGRERREDRPENREFGNLQVQITRQVEADYPGARWVWKDPNPKEKFLQGDTLGILLNRAGGYREAALRLEGHTLSSVQYLGAPAEKLRLPQQEEAGTAPAGRYQRPCLSMGGIPLGGAGRPVQRVHRPGAGFSPDFRG